MVPGANNTSYLPLVEDTIFLAAQNKSIWIMWQKFSNPGKALVSFEILLAH